MSSPVELASEERRTPLNRSRVLQAAVDLADRDGVDSVSMRRLGQHLGIEAMSLYTHVRGKDDLLDGMVDVVVGEIPIDVVGPDWRTTLRRQVLAARSVMLRHRWAARIIETRTTPGPATLRYMEAVTGILLDAFSVDLSHHAMHVLGSRVLGFSQDLYDDAGAPDPEVAAAYAAQLASVFPNIGALAMTATHEGGIGGCDDEYEFAFGLDLILDGLERRRVS